jgi:enoyl-CoA hydratase/carnithine racemase
VLSIDYFPDGTAVVTLRWTEKRNSLAPEDASEVAEAIRTASAQASAVVLTGEGSFCAGGDLKRFAELSATETIGDIKDKVYGNVQSMIRSIRDSPVPVISAVDGAAVGLGMDLALATDLCFVGPKGWLRQGWGQAGIIAGTGGVSFLQSVRPGLVWRLLATQERLDAQLCHDLGVAEIGLPTALDAARLCATALAGLGRDVVNAYTRLARPCTWPEDDHFNMCAEIQARLIGSANFRELSAQVLTQTNESK